MTHYIGENTLSLYLQSQLISDSIGVISKHESWQKYLAINHERNTLKVQESSNYLLFIGIDNSTQNSVMFEYDLSDVNGTSNTMTTYDISEIKCSVFQWNLYIKSDNDQVVYVSGGSSTETYRITRIDRETKQTATIDIDTFKKVMWTDVYKKFKLVSVAQIKNSI